MKGRKIVFTGQQDKTDCAAACLCMIAGYYGKRISIARIRKLAGTDIRGTSGKGIVKAAETLGFSCKGLFFSNKTLRNSLPCPLIINLIKDGLEHYIVVYKIKNGKILIADPADTLKWMDEKTVYNWWTGYCFLLNPTKSFKDILEDSSVLSHFSYNLRENKNVVIQILLASFILTVLGIISAFYFRFLIDEVVYSYLSASLTSVSIAYFIVIIFQNLLLYARNHLINFFGNKMEAKLSLEYFSHILHLPLDFFTKRRSGEILSRFTDISTIRATLSSVSVGVILDVSMLIFIGIVLFSSSSILVGIAVIPAILSASLVLLFSKKIRYFIHKRAIIDSMKYSHFVESINGISTIKALSIEDDSYCKAENKIIQSIEEGFNLMNLNNLQTTLQLFLSQSGNLAIYWYGTWKIIQGSLTLGELVSFVTLLGYFLGPLGRLITLQTQFQEFSVASKRLGEILDLDEEKFNEGLLVPQEIQGNIEIKHLSFSYGTRGITLENISLEIKAGEKVAFVGTSGSGKTTLVKLLLKFYKPDKGEIFLDSKNISDINTKSYRSFFGYVPQEILLFSGSIQENIALGNDETTAEDVFNVAKNTQCLDFISNLKDRFATAVGEKGSSLSGGERQRIALARTLLRNPKILILDEATSSLDSITESSIMKTIDSMSKNLTTIIVAHRLSTIKHCDKIFVFQNGKIVESGKHLTLLKKNGIYTKMWESQNL